MTTPARPLVDENEEDQGVAADAAALAPSGSSPSGSQAEPPAANAGHTPLPWRVRTDGEVYAGVIQGAPERGERYGFFVTNREGLAKPKTQGAANAAFIVRACNSHYDLLEALEWALHGWDAEGEITDACRDNMAAAIAKATGAA